MLAVIPAAGSGTRFMPATKAIPKEMLPVLNKPTIQYVVEEALAAADEVLIVINDGKQAIRNHFSPDERLVESLMASGKDEYAVAVRHAASLPVSYVNQDQPLGLGHAVYMANAFLQADGQPFFVLLGDVLVPGNNLLQQMLGVSQTHDNASVIAVQVVPDEEVHRYGIVIGDDLSDRGEPGVWRIQSMVEKPKTNPGSNLAIFGRYLLSPSIMAILADTPPGAGGEIQLTDAMVTLLQSEPMYALTVKADAGFDVGTVDSWLQTNFLFAAAGKDVLA